MALEFRTENDGRLLIVTATGALTVEDYEAFQPEAQKLIEAFGRIRIAFDMCDFEGWEIGALWEDIKFDARNFNNIERVAMIGDQRWQEWMAAFCKPFTGATVKYFDRLEMLNALDWVRGEVTQSA